jgi:Asp-tRNA(Asn)/Glu-tRNA(Gln) amidotransferase A subunit family amidase
MSDGAAPLSASGGAAPLDPFGAFLSREVVRGAPDGILASVTVAVKDNIAVQGQPFTAGHPLYTQRKGWVHATAVRRLLAAGAQVVGMTRTDSGGFGVTTPEVANPVHPGRSVGGSSGGAAAAVAAGLAELGLGTDTGGSIRLPAACTGLFGWKPSYGRVPMDGVWPLAPSLDHPGLIARSLTILARAARVILAEDAPAIGFPPMSRPLVLGLEQDLPAYTAPAIRAALERIERLLLRRGHRVCPVHVGDRRALVGAFGLVVTEEAREVYAGLRPDEYDALGPAAQAALRRAGPAGGEALGEARATLRQQAARLTRQMKGLDALLGATLHINLPERGEDRIQRADGRSLPVLAAFLAGTCGANVAGVPALAMPIPGLGGEDTISLHLTGRWGHDLELLSVAAAIGSSIEA